LQALTAVQPQRPAVQAFALGTSSQSSELSHSQRPVAVLQRETPTPPQSPSFTQRQRRTSRSHTEPFLEELHSALLRHPGTHAPSTHVRLAFAQTRALPAAPKRGSMTSSAFGSTQPFAEGASLAQRPTPPTSTQRSSLKKKQSASVVQSKIQRLASGRHSSELRQGSAKRSQRRVFALQR
jgi:hypothetical protein